jgi:hypothetical protein
MNKIKIDKELILEYTSISNDPNAYNYVARPVPAFEQKDIDQMHMLSPFEKQSLTNVDMDQIQNDPIKKRALDKVKQFYQQKGKSALEFVVTQHNQFTR